MENAFRRAEQLFAPPAVHADALAPEKCGLDLTFLDEEARADQFFKLPRFPRADTTFLGYVAQSIEVARPLLAFWYTGGRKKLICVYRTCLLVTIRF